MPLAAGKGVPAVEAWRLLGSEEGGTVTRGPAAQTVPVETKNTFLSFLRVTFGIRRNILRKRPFGRRGNGADWCRRVYVETFSISERRSQSDVETFGRIKHPPPSRATSDQRGSPEPFHRVPVETFFVPFEPRKCFYVHPTSPHRVHVETGGGDVSTGTQRFDVYLLAAGPRVTVPPRGGPLLAPPCATLRLAAGKGVPAVEAWRFLGSEEGHPWRHLAPPCA
eukprot:gene12501-biopygen7757